MNHTNDDEGLSSGSSSSDSDMSESELEEEDATVVEDSNTGRPRRAARDRGIDRLLMDTRGKDYQSTRYRTFLLRNKLNRVKTSVLLTMLTTKLRSANTTPLMQRAVNCIFLTAQMNASKGIKLLGERAVAAMVKEFRQLDEGAFPGKPVVEPISPDSITEKEEKEALEAVNLIKEKRNGDVKGRTCADGSRQRRFLGFYDSVASPTVSLEALILTLIMDAYEDRTVAVFDVPGAYLHANMPEGKRIIMKLRGQFVDLMCEANPKYSSYVKVVNGKKLLYLRVLRAIYGCIQSALLWYRLFTTELSNMGFTINPYDKCVANKQINGKQCTIVWYVDDVKISHAEEKVVRQVISDIERPFGKMNVTIGKEHEYLGMKVRITDDRKIEIDMREQIDEILESFGYNIEDGASTPAARHLMMVNAKGILLDPKRKESFHSNTAKLLYLEKRARPDIETAVAFLTTRVSNPDEDDWKKLIRVLSYLKTTKNELRIIGCNDLKEILTWVDAAYAVHPNMRSHTGGALSLGHGIVHSRSSKQKLNTKSSTEAELVGLSDYVPYNVWITNFLSEQGYSFRRNVVWQDNQSTIKMARNGRNSCTGNSRHIHIRYFFVKDRIDKGEFTVEYCPTEHMLADYFTKPLQGSLFKRFKDVIMGHKDISSLRSPHIDEMKERVEKQDFSDVISKSEEIPIEQKISKKVRFAQCSRITNDTNLGTQHSTPLYGHTEG